MSFYTQHQNHVPWKRNVIIGTIKIKMSALRGILLKEWRDNINTGRKYAQNIYVIKDLYPKYAKNSYFLI